MLESVLDERVSELLFSVHSDLCNIEADFLIENGLRLVLLWPLGPYCLLSRMATLCTILSLSILISRAFPLTRAGP